MDDAIIPPNSLEPLAIAARRYAAQLFSSAPRFFPGSTAKVHSFFAHIGRAENPDVPDDTPGSSAWAWTRFLAGWPQWRPQHLVHQLLLPPAELLNRFAVLCRNAACEQPQAPTPPKRWSLFARPASSQVAPTQRDLLTHTGDLLESIAELHSPDLQREFDRIAELGKAVDDAIAALPQEFVPARLARVCMSLTEWPSFIPSERFGFLPWLAGMLFFTLDRKHGSIAPELLAAVMQEARQEFREEARLAPEIQSALERLTRASPVENWFLCLAGMLNSENPATPLSPWHRLMARLLALSLLEIAPRFEPPVDVETLTVPRDWLTPGRADIRYIVHEAEPGTAVKVDRFASPPKRAAVAVSLGPNGGSAIAVAAAWDALAGAGLDLDDFRDLLAPALESAVQCGTPIPDKLLARVVDRLGTLANEGHKHEPSWDAFLQRVREWASAEEQTILPADWTFADGGPLPDAVPGLTVKAVFRRDVPAGRIAKVKSFGLVGRSGVVRTGDVVVSAGSPPPGLAELEAAVEHLEGEIGIELREAIKALRPAGAGGYLEIAAIDLFTRYWDRAASAWSALDASATTVFGERLRVMLREGFKLETFEPSSYRDHPSGWILVPPGMRMTTGRVLRVLRPGLVAGEVIRVPARVEAE